MATRKTIDPASARAQGDGQALLVVDVQKGLFERGTPIYQADAVLAKIAGLIGQARAVGAPVIYIRHCDSSFLVESTDGWQLHPALQPAPGELLIQKRHGNAFQDTSLAAELAGRSIGTVVVTGLVSHGCVKATCLGALDLGYRVVLASDAHSNFSQQAAAIIEKWNRGAAQAGIEVRAAGEISLGPPSR